MSLVYAPTRRLLLALQWAGEAGLGTRALARAVYGDASPETVACVHSLASRARRHGFAIATLPKPRPRAERGYRLEGRPIYEHPQ